MRLTNPMPAEICYRGNWTIRVRNETPSFALHYHFSNCSGPTDLESLGITSDQLNGSKTAVAFDVRRDAGTFTCSGEAGGGVAKGTFRFHPNTDWSAEVQALGLRCSLFDQVRAAMFGLTVPYVRGIVDAGYKSVAFMDLYSLRMRETSLEDVRAFRAAFPDASFDEVTLLGWSKASPELVTALRSAGVHDLTAENVIALRSLGVDEAFVSRLVGAGKTDLSVDEVAALNATGF